MNHINFIRRETKKYASDSFLETTPQPNKRRRNKRDADGELPTKADATSTKQPRAVVTKKKTAANKRKADVDQKSADLDRALRAPVSNGIELPSTPREIFDVPPPTLLTPLTATYSSRKRKKSLKRTPAKQTSPIKFLTPNLDLEEEESLNDLTNYEQSLCDGIGVEFAGRIGTPVPSIPVEEPPKRHSSRKAVLKIKSFREKQRRSAAKLNTAFVQQLKAPVIETETSEHEESESNLATIFEISYDTSEDDENSVEAEASSSISPQKRDWVNFNCLISKTQPYFDRLESEMTKVNKTTDFTEEQLNYFTRKVCAKYLKVLDGPELVDGPKFWRHKEFLSIAASGRNSNKGKRLVLMSNPESHFTEDQKDLCTYVLNAVLTDVWKRNLRRKNFPIRTEMDLVYYISEVMVPEILFRLYAKVAKVSYGEMKRITETSQGHSRGTAG